MWKQPSSVKLCTYIILHSEAQTINCRNMRNYTFGPERDLRIHKQAQRKTAGIITYSKTIHVCMYFNIQHTLTPAKMPVVDTLKSR